MVKSRSKPLASVAIAIIVAAATATAAPAQQPSTPAETAAEPQKFQTVQKRVCKRQLVQLPGGASRQGRRICRMVEEQVPVGAENADVNDPRQPEDR